MVVVILAVILASSSSIIINEAVGNEFIIVRYKLYLVHLNCSDSCFSDPVLKLFRCKDSQGEKDYHVVYLYL